MATRQSIVSRMKRTGVRFDFVAAVDCHRLCLRNDKNQRIHHEESEEFEVTSCHCEEGMKVSDAAIHRVSKKRTGVRFVYCGAVDRHGLLALAMTNRGLLGA